MITILPIREAHKAVGISSYVFQGRNLKCQNIWIASEKLNFRFPRDLSFGWSFLVTIWVGKIRPCSKTTAWGHLGIGCYLSESAECVANLTYEPAVGGKSLDTFHYFLNFFPSLSFISPSPPIQRSTCLKLTKWSLMYCKINKIVTYLFIYQLIFWGGRREFQVTE